MQINFARREIGCKIVYYGPGMSGKTTNLEIVHAKTPRENKGELTCIATEGDRTLFFDFMPLNLGNIMGMNTKFQLYTVPGQVYYNSTRKLVLRGVDGVIFIADSAKDMIDENLESLRNLEENLREYGRDVREIPVILQYNKRDRSDALDVETLNRKLNPEGRPCFEGVATEGVGVFDCLKALAGMVIQNLNKECSRQRSGSDEGGTEGPVTKAERGAESAGVVTDGGGTAVATATRAAASLQSTKTRPARSRPRKTAPAPRTTARPTIPRAKPIARTRPATVPRKAARPAARLPEPAGGLPRLSQVAWFVTLVAALGAAAALVWFLYFRG